MPDDIRDSDGRVARAASPVPERADAGESERTIALLLVAGNRALAQDLLQVLEAHLLAPHADGGCARDIDGRKRLERLARLERLREGLIETLGRDPTAPG